MSRLHNVGQTAALPPARVAKLSWIGRAAWIVAMIGGPIAGALLYAGPLAGMAVYRCIVDGGMAMLWLAAAWGWGRWALRALKLDQNPLPLSLRMATSTALGLGIMSLLVLGLGLAGMLQSGAAWGLLATGWFGAAASLRTFATGSGRRAWFQSPPAAPGWNWIWLAAVPLVALVLIAALVPPGFLWTPREPHGYDVVEYHLQAPREWFEAGRIVALHHNVYAYFPFNVEMHYLLAMHLSGGPWAGMYLCQFMHAAFMLLTIVATHGVARRFSGPAGAAIAALALLTAPWFAQLSAIAYDEGGFLLFGTLAIGWTLMAMLEPERRQGRWILAGALAGLAAGCKLTAVPEVLVATPVICAAVGLLTRWNARQRRQSLGLNEPADHSAGNIAVIAGALLFGVAGLVVFSPWLIRNYIWAGNPVFPELMPLLGRGTFDAGQVQRWELAHQAPPDLRSLGARLHALVSEVIAAWQWGYVLLPGAVVGWILNLRKPAAQVLFALLIALTIFWMGFTHLQGRFFMLGAPLAALLLAQIRWRGFLAVAGAGVIAVFVLIAFARLHIQLSRALYEESLAQTIGLENLDFMFIASLQSRGFTTSDTLQLIGDARAFWYPLPMSRLKYRTVFDVPGVGASADYEIDFGPSPDSVSQTPRYRVRHEVARKSGMVQAWIGDAAPDEKTWLEVDRAELARFARTYRNLPALEDHLPFGPVRPDPGGSLPH